MTNPAHSDTGDDGRRWYVIGGTRYMSVTTALGQVAKHGLPQWAAGLAADAALDRADWVAAAAGTDPCNALPGDECGSCRECARVWLADRHNQVRDAAADRGTRLHEATAHLDTFGVGGSVDEDIKPFFTNYKTWLAYYRPEIVATDAVVVNRTWGYAGSLDKIVRFGKDSRLPSQWAELRGQNLVLDEKTTNHVYLTHGLQVAAYAGAEAIVLPDGTEEPMPPIGGGLILHNRADKIQTRRVSIGAEAFNLFIHILRAAEGVSTTPLGTVLSRPVNIPKPRKATK